ncbi:MAG: hypothetical protein IJI14_15825 [Anaerolineaceae bacterium]|nr:hypothetical protein [Anaerolineaceae bacterium]
MKWKQHFYHGLAVALMLSLQSSPYVVYADVGEFAKRLLKPVSMITDSVLIILSGLITLITVISIVKSGVMAQLNTQLGRKLHLSNEIVLVLETIAIFAFAMVVLPLVRGVITTAVQKGYGGSTDQMLGLNFNFH